MSATLTSDFSFARLALASVRRVMCLLVLVLLLFAPALASEDEERSKFWDWVPAAPDINLPKIHIPTPWTSDLKTARKAYKRGNYDRALTYFSKASEDGNIVADWYLGHMFRLGQGVARDAAVSYSYYSRVAENYDPDEDDADRLRIAVDSQIHLADFLREGVPSAGIKADPPAAARSFLRIASSYGHPAAMYNLGVMNIQGDGIRKNPQQGLKWLMSAARKRHAEAEAYLGELYHNGDVVRADQTRALMWYMIASETATPEEQVRFLPRYNELKQTASDDMRLEAEARARVWVDQYPVGGR